MTSEAMSVEGLSNMPSRPGLHFIIFALALQVSEYERKECYKISRPLWLHTVLVNDLFSWEKEYGKTQKPGANQGPMNAICVLMEKHGMTLDQARLTCIERAKEFRDEYLEIVEDKNLRLDISQDGLRLLDNLRLFAGGHVFWSAECPRFRPGQEQDQELKITERNQTRDTTNSLRVEELAKPMDTQQTVVEDKRRTDGYN